MVSFLLWKTRLCIIYFRKDLYSSEEEWHCTTPDREQQRKSKWMHSLIQSMAASAVFLLVHRGDWKWLVVGSACDSIYLFFNPSFVGRGVKGSALSTSVQSPARFFPELPCACYWCRCVRSQGDDTLSHQRPNKSHADVWLHILLTSTKGFCKIATRVSCGSREDMMYSSLLKSSCSHSWHISELHSNLWCTF